MREHLCKPSCVCILELSTTLVAAVNQPPRAGMCALVNVYHLPFGIIDSEESRLIWSYCLHFSFGVDEELHF